MDEAVSPTVARRRVRLALREARESANLTQLQVAEEMEWSLSKVIRIESGEVSVAPNDLRPLLNYLGVRDRAVINALVADAKIARTRQRQAWYQKPEFREHLTDAYRRLIEYEAEASAIRYFSIYFLPGPFQLPDYAAALMHLWDGEMPQAKIDRLLEARRHRRDALFARIKSVELLVLLDESVLMRPIGGIATFARQLRELEKLATTGYIKILMVPFTLDAPVTNNASFDLLSLGRNDADGMLLYHESGLADEVIEDKSTTERHRHRYDKVWQDAFPESDTIGYIRERIETLEADDTDRRQNLK